MEALHSHFDIAFHINLGALQLTRLGTSMGMLSADGRLKVLRNDCDIVLFN